MFKSKVLQLQPFIFEFEFHFIHSIHGQFNALMFLVGMTLYSKCIVHCTVYISMYSVPEGVLEA